MKLKMPDKQIYAYVYITLGGTMATKTRYTELHKLNVRTPHKKNQAVDSATAEWWSAAAISHYLPSHLYFSDEDRQVRC